MADLSCDVDQAEPPVLLVLHFLLGTHVKAVTKSIMAGT